MKKKADPWNKIRNRSKTLSMVAQEQHIRNIIVNNYIAPQYIGNLQVPTHVKFTKCET